MENRWKYHENKKTYTKLHTSDVCTIWWNANHSSLWNWQFKAPGLNFFEASGKMLADSIKFPGLMSRWPGDHEGPWMHRQERHQSFSHMLAIFIRFHFIPMGYNCQPIEKLPTLCLLYLHFCFVARGPSKKSLASLDGNTTLLKRKWTIQFQETGPVLYDEFGPSGKCHVHVGDESRNKFDASIGRLALQAPSILYALGFRGWKWEKTFV